MSAGCVRPPPASLPEPRYTLGAPYELGGLWSYPREDFSLVETGLAAVLPNRTAGQRTANGEIFDPSALTAAHRTLQLPAIVVVTNLERGLQLAVRVNDRGPAMPGRVLGLSPRAAALLGVPAGGVAQVRVALDAGPSRALAASLPADFAQGPAVALAPAGTVTAEALAPIDGARQAPRGPAASAGGAVLGEAGANFVVPPARLPEQVVAMPAAPGVLVVEAGRFFRRDLAARRAAMLAASGARVAPIGAGRQVQWRVVIGPFYDIAAADAAVAAVLAAGIPEVSLAVE